MAEQKIFVPHELKTIEVDVEKKIFRVNGEDFGKGCTGFTIGCEAGKEDFFSICMRIETDVRYVNYDESGKLISDRTIEMHGRKDG